MLTIAIDAMGGDFGPAPIVEGTLQALKERQFKALLVGDINVLKPLIPQEYLAKISFVEASDILDMHEAATNALKRKETSIYKAVDLVKDKVADAVVSMGHSGATMSLATLRIGRLKGVLRPAIATIMPTAVPGKLSLVLDVGANVDCKAEHLAQFAIMGETYAKDVLKIAKPKVGLLSNGEEESKGNEITKEAFAILKKIESFVGNVEGNNVFDGSVDVIVCDGFVGNILLKASEGVADSITKIIKQNVRRSPLAIAGAVLMRKVFKVLKKQVDYAEYGGAPLIGINGCAIIGHGKSNAKAVKNAIYQAINFSSSGINTDIEQKLVLLEQ
ncbi:phosphate acyltransferase PlsX [Sulfurospirillum diekertiae]|jgi:glycerol-3-phosphate acyltransferase PlsX|uniref:Phosphate acyltransferase n=1 Tax=Sulfurospirillum diekertiae TaxID=1854492 RepID=A0A290HP25_9BACT|nr:phosphate acyltransferase PlsX [Sulfurospirillum diekertiae]ATB68394.1 phosphate acyltransferase [Sulfurospirillum diekertiae]QIR76249.1 phosphate acyltransferase PlsX [Sulfurospirillum diekertiae]QIR78880.1 phosphate acyltransferase PlsX [Sulfurospirillum diekertiae]